MRGVLRKNTERRTNGGRSRFSPDGSAVYDLLDRASVLTLSTGGRCGHRQPVSAPVILAPVSAMPAGLLPVSIFNLISVTRDRVFFNLAEAHGNVWLTQLE